MTVDTGDAGAYQPYRAIAGYWLLVVALVIVGAGLVAGLNAARSATYTSTSTVAWNPNFRANLPALSGAPSAGVQPAPDLATAAVRVRGDAVMASASAVVGVPADALRDSTTVSSSVLNDTITITVRAPSAEDSQKRTDTVTNRFVEESRRQLLATLRVQAAQVAEALASVSGVLTPGETADLRSNQALLAAAAASADGPASVVQSATKPVDTRGKLTRNTAIGGVLGLVLGVLVALGLGARARRPHARQSLSE